MITNLRLARILVGGACLLTVGTACTSAVSGTPSAAPTTQNSTPTGSDVFAGLDACQLLDQLNAGQGFAPGENKSRRNQCTASKPGFATYGLALDSVQGLSEFDAANAGATSISVNGRDGMQADIPVGGCAVAVGVGVGVGEHARALVLVTMERASEDAHGCPNARAFAEKVEPLLPQAR
ncbi:hypothetical protein GCM10027445_39700 [Amycolatopsis endophytica]|uniref:DUF3558 domain-containing protein n=1 Tax=Amycolatopsis endophytica TaxID=860233 RepID=A0A853B0H1_9PSEU|nr:DUF3558 domain-containing protein [Amycolatopsis endophytica]NYI88334.1 hypothetical protein [Amycolatopsis endophytica]